MMMTSVQQLAQSILNDRPTFQAKLGIILGSGLADIADKLTDSISIPYAELPGFPVSSVEGHHGKMIVGYLNKIPVVCYQGRIHLYEGMHANDFKLFIRTLKYLGCRAVIMTNAVGSLTKNVDAGQLVLISDHINLHPMNPLTGPNDEEFGPRFFAMDDAYDPGIRHIIRQAAKQLSIPLTEGIYLSVLGPNFETPAEIRAFRQWGADVVGMSTVPEVIVARHCGLKVAVISVVTNLAAGLSKEPITHEGTVHFAAKASHHLGRLIEASVVPIAQQFSAQ
ncbi:purine-nucleoside phosphorylase [Rickettsiella grylli]|uniref:Purine nucleoside phosphorylase n=1 Tax=Rickettsiella grylli TaxID=59196 RepID=A8PLA6_9COXI|nr:purine-nucleoside phosphorylase [Rickettsiella grylli]EDP46445.1 purine nucleoside phosphorylase I, inosine and guanosine-specific [Rickettsiella grylli]